MRVEEIDLGLVADKPLRDTSYLHKMPKFLRTSDLAHAIGVHVNTIRIYESMGLLLDIPRGTNGYRRYTPMHLEQARLVYLATSWPYLNKDKVLLRELATRAANGDLGMAMELAYEHLAHVRMERTYAEAAIEFLERWAAGYLMDSSQEKMNISQAAQHLNVSVDMLRNWERNGLIDIPRDPTNNYRLYGSAEFGRLRVIRMLVQSGYSLMAVLQMLRQFDAGNTANLRHALNIPPEAHETIPAIADRWLSGLLELEYRAQATIRQISKMIEMTYR